MHRNVVVGLATILGSTLFAAAAFAIFALACTLRIVHIWQMRSSPFFAVLLGDTRGYDEWAQRIAAGDWIGLIAFRQIIVRLAKPVDCHRALQNQPLRGEIQQPGFRGC